MPAPRHDRVGLVARINVTKAELAALDAKRADRQAEMWRLIAQLGRLPSDDNAPVLPVSEHIPIGQAVGIAGCSDDTLIRHGDPAGWCFRRGGRRFVDLAGLRSWMAGRQVRP